MKLFNYLAAILVPNALSRSAGRFQAGPIDTGLFYDEYLQETAYFKASVLRSKITETIKCCGNKIISFYKGGYKNSRKRRKTSAEDGRSRD